MRVLPRRSARTLKTQHIIAAIIPAAIVVMSITGFVWAQKEVTVVVDGRTLHIKTQAADVAGALAEAGVACDADDVVTPPSDSELVPGSTVVVRHSIPVIVQFGGEAVKLDVVGDTVADALVAAGADPAATDAVQPPIATGLVPGMTIKVPDVFVRVVKHEERIAPKVEVEADSSLARGTRRVITSGKAGRVLTVSRVVVTNGVEGSPVRVAQRVVSKPTPTIVAVGTGSRTTTSAQPARVPVAPAHGRRMRVVATGYSPQQPDLDYVTATGARAERGVIAVDPKMIPLGTRVYVPGYGYAVAADTGGAIDGRRIDLCYNTVAEAMRWGRRSVTIIILD